MPTNDLGIYQVMVVSKIQEFKCIQLKRFVMLALVKSFVDSPRYEPNAEWQNRIHLAMHSWLQIISDAWTPESQTPLSIMVKPRVNQIKAYKWMMILRNSEIKLVKELWTIAVDMRWLGRCLFINGQESLVYDTTETKRDDEKRKGNISLRIRCDFMIQHF